MSFDPITNAGVKALQGQVNTVQTKLAQIENTQAALRKPLRVTEYTSGAGTHSFLPDSNHQHILLIGAGGGGGYGFRNYSNGYTYWGSGGGAGDELHRRAGFKGSVAYQVGAGSMGKGGSTRLGHLWVDGGAVGFNALVDNNGAPTPMSTRQGNGISAGSQGNSISGGDSMLGKGGINSTPLAGLASGYGAGGGGTCGHVSNSTTPSPGTGGYIRIEEY